MGRVRLIEEIEGQARARAGSVGDCLLYGTGEAPDLSAVLPERGIETT